MSGRLTLDWANKDRVLVSHGESGYEWVDPDDPRATEVRLLDECGRVGEVTGAASDNLLIRGDSAHALRALVRTPEYADEYRGKVKLVYIDPPFNTGQAFEHYDDALEHSVWLGMMRERLLLVRELLAPDGSVWVHLDDAEMAYCKVLMDEIFGRSNFVATVVWQKSYTRENRTAISASHDSILVFSPLGDDWKGVRSALPNSDAQIARYVNPDSDPRGPYKPTPMHAKAEKGRRREQFYTIVTPSGRQMDPPPGRCWLFTEPRYKEMLKAGRIYFGRNGDGVPTLKKFLNEVQAGLVPNTWWIHEEVGNTGTGKAELIALFPGQTPFSTPKPERLLERIIHIGSNPGDIVLDCFAGSGTTAAVAHKMGRRWVTAEVSESTVDTFTAPRLTKVVNGEDPGGVTASTGWAGGGGYRELRVAPSTFQATATPEYSAITLDMRLDDRVLSRSVAAQLGYRLDPSRPPFVATLGRSRLAVIRGVVDEVVIGDLLGALDDDETAIVAGTLFMSDAASVLRTYRKGSRILRLPSGLFPAGGVVR